MAKVRIYSDNSTTFSALFLDKQGGEGKTDTLHGRKTHLERTKTELVRTKALFVHKRSGQHQTMALSGTNRRNVK